MNPLWTPAQIDEGVPARDVLPALRAILRWSKGHLTAPHPALGRSGPVCPYTAPALRRDLLRFTVATMTATGQALHRLMSRMRLAYAEHASGLKDAERELLAYLIVLPRVDPLDAAGLNRVQEGLKDEFVADGLMVGQFHPRCDEPGLWNHAYRPLRSPVPLLAIRQMRDVDLPFLTESGHLRSYFERFTAGLPVRVRGQLVHRLTGTEATP
ncbi:DUF6875 domain-containing protein [Phytomonospora endophytica]|uniref:DUF6875 domain-containing protein n=1 Tax=Phytomonospora endophytica TaxID=714109 RepID=A0A841FYL6_9ACTN|nr:hypothetical protein [Phytomonospora endophytica]MBB6038612.1 hypothetical protein [Phytomonospora endophytica]GIG69244.1 hypothetical protein Pen01_55390 [Phytomonospora endophytica]